MNARPRIVCLVGPTASGKSALAVELAERLGGAVGIGLELQHLSLKQQHIHNVVDAALLTLFIEIVIDLAGAENDAANLVVLDELDLLARLAAGELFEAEPPQPGRGPRSGLPPRHAAACARARTMYPLHQQGLHIWQPQAHACAQWRHRSVLLTKSQALLLSLPIRTALLSFCAFQSRQFLLQL